MRWPFKRRASAARSEQALWAHLDACALPFRAPVAEWVRDGHVTPSVWSAGIDYVLPDLPKDAPLFIPGLDTPMRVQLVDRTDLSAPPGYLWGAVRDQDSAALNYARAVAQISALFGPGTEASSSNTLAQIWQFGHARLSCTAFPPELQDPNLPPNQRHTLEPGSQCEARIDIQPAWREPAEVAQCAGATLIWADPAPAALDGPLPSALTRFSRDWPTDVPALPPGIARTPEGAVLYIRAGGVVDVFAPKTLDALRLNRVGRARGAAFCALDAQYSTHGPDGPLRSHCTLARVDGSEAALDDVAAQVAQAADLPLRRLDSLND